MRFKFFVVLLILVSCADYSKPIPGRDKMGAGLLSGAAFGAGSGAITGAQFTASTGPGIWIGMGFGAVWGGLQGLGLDILEEEDLRIIYQVINTSDEVWAQYAILEHYDLKNDLHPGRDIFPADLFFAGSGTKLTEKGEAIAKVFVESLVCTRPSSRIEITVYNVSKDIKSSYSSFLGRKRADSLARILVDSGIEPRRLVTRSIILDNPLVIDPFDSPDRYYQALEFALLD
jgi:hypothetical protein